MTDRSRWGVAALLAGAGLIHLVMAPSHLGTATVEGVGFVITGWAQIALACVIVARGARWALLASIAVNAGAIGAWIVSRTAGLPFGDHAGHAATMSLVDGICVGLEAVAIVAATSLLLAPSRAPNGRAALVIPVAAVLFATAAIASPSARDHASTSHGGHGDAHDEHAATDSADHAHDEPAPADDKGLSLLVNGHQHETGEVPIDPTTRRALAAQLAQTRALLDSYPTVAAAETAGYRRAGPFTPGLGAHYQPPGYGGNADGLMDPEDIANPMLIFDGTAPDSPLAGFMYLAGREDAPEGFVGPNDHWHFHTNVCIVFADGELEIPFGADSDEVTADMCSAVGGSFIAYTQHMVHVWTVPGYESSRGVFSEINPAITCPDGTYHAIPLRELTDEIDTRTTTCRSEV